MSPNKKALGEDEFKLYHQGIIKALKEKAFKFEVQPHVGDTAPEDTDISAWFDTSDTSDIQEVMVMSVSEEENLTFNEEEETVIQEEEEEIVIQEEEEEIVIQEEEELIINEEE